jgi:hypothetical protein
VILYAHVDDPGCLCGVSLDAHEGDPGCLRGVILDAYGV